jgi:hypothetical protein
MERPSGSTPDGFETPEASRTYSTDSQGAAHLDHGVRKWIKTDAPAPHVRPTAPFASVLFHARVNAQVPHYPAAGETSPAGSTPGRSTTSTTATTRQLQVADTGAEPFEAILGFTRITRGMEIALRSMNVGESADFLVPEEMAHYYGAGVVPPRCPFDMELRLLGCDNAVPVARLPTVDLDVFKITRNASGASGATAVGADAAAPKRPQVTLGCVVDFFVQRPNERTGAMNPPVRQTTQVGMAAVDPVFDMMLLAMSEREIATFVLRASDGTASQFVMTVVSVAPPKDIAIPVTAAQLMRVYTGESGDEGSAPIDLTAVTPEAVASTIASLRETGRATFEANRFAVAIWHYAAASAITRVRGGAMAETNRELALLSRNAGRCAYRLRRFTEALALARESYSFDTSDVKGAFLLAQALRECDQLLEARTIVAQCAKMAGATPEITEESVILEAKIAVRTNAAAASGPATPAKT